MHFLFMTTRKLRMQGLGALIACSVTLSQVQAASVTLEAEDGTLGADWNVVDSSSPAYITISTPLINGAYPGSAARVASFDVTFPEAGDYALYAHLYVGPGTYDDDSFFYAKSFGAQSPTTGSDWISINGLAANLGFAGAIDVVTDAGGTVGS